MPKKGTYEVRTWVELLPGIRIRGRRLIPSFLASLEHKNITDIVSAVARTYPVAFSGVCQRNFD